MCLRLFHVGKSVEIEHLSGLGEVHASGVQVLFENAHRVTIIQTTWSLWRVWMDVVDEEVDL